MTLLPSRRVSAAFLGVFVIGALVGALSCWTFTDMRLSRFLNKTSNPEKMAERINHKYISELHLSADEQSKIAPLTQEMTQQLYKKRREFGVDIIATLDDYHRRIGEQMSPGHRETFQQANLERRKRMSAILLPDQPASDTGEK